VITQTWAITSQLVLPLTAASPIDLLVRDIPTIQWVAGAIAIAGGALALVFGSRWIKLLVIWTAVGIAPFTLWDLNYTSPRYVYMAAVPFSIILSWGVVEVVRFVTHALHFKPLQGLALAGTAAAIAVACVISWQTVQSRDATWSAETAKYRPLAENLKTALKDPPKNGGRLIIYYGYWPDFWASAVARTVYGDKKLYVVSVPGKVADTNFPRVRPNDVVVYYLEDHFVQVGLASR
jgi:membrane protein implicated in regulation of membrane protease activity